MLRHRGEFFKQLIVAASQLTPETIPLGDLKPSLLLLQHSLPIVGFKPVVLPLRQPTFGFGYTNPVVEIIERIKISFSDRKTNRFLGEGPLKG